MGPRATIRRRAVRSYSAIGNSEALGFGHRRRPGHLRQHSRSVGAGVSKRQRRNIRLLVIQACELRKRPRSSVNRQTRAAWRRPGGVLVLAALRAAELEGEHDLGDAAEHGEEPDPDQQQHGRGGGPLRGDPETKKELWDAPVNPEPQEVIGLPPGGKRWRPRRGGPEGRSRGGRATRSGGAETPTRAGRAAREPSRRCRASRRLAWTEDSCACLRSLRQLYSTLSRGGVNGGEKSYMQPSRWHLLAQDAKSEASSVVGIS